MKRGLLGWLVCRWSGLRLETGDMEMKECLNRFTMQTIVTKLDTNAITLSDAKLFFKKQGVTIEGRTKSIFIKNLTKAVSENK